MPQDTISELADKLRPYLAARAVAAGSGGPPPVIPPAAAPSQVDYVLSIMGAVCQAHDGRTGRLAFAGSDHASVIQQAADAAGLWGSLGFTSGVYTLARPVSPQTGQCWRSENATFQPLGDVTALRIVGVDHLKLLGVFRFVDAFGVTASQPAMFAYSMRYAQVDHIYIQNYYKGIDLQGNTAGAGTNENVFLDLYMQVRHRGLNLEGSCHDNKFVQVWVKGPAPDAWATGAGIRIATSGTQGGNSLDRCQILDMQTGLDCPGAYEFWFGTVVCDNAFANAVYIAGSCERLFFDTVWAASSGDGIYMEGNTVDYPVTAADKVYMSKVYAWLNANYGIRLEGYVQQLTMDTVVVQRNDNVGLAFNRWRNESVRIGTLISLENKVVGVDGAGAGPGCVIKNALIYDGITSPENFEMLEGAAGTGATFQNRGTAVVAAGQSAVVVEHGLVYTPVQVWLGHEHPETTGAYVTGKTPYTFTIQLPAAATGVRVVHWRAEAYRKTVGGELLKNADVEAGQGSPDDWYASASGAVWDAAEKRTGYRSLKLQVSGGMADWRSAPFAVTGTRHYRMQAMVKGTGSGQCFLTIRWFSDPNASAFIAEENRSVSGIYANWTQILGWVQSPPNAQSADLLLRCPSPTTINLNADDFSVRQLL